LLAILQNGLILLGVSSTGRRFLSGWSFSSRFGDGLVAARATNPEARHEPGRRHDPSRAYGPSGRQRTIATLALLLLALWAVFAIAIGDRFFSVNTLQSMAFQMPELGILSLAMMLALLSGGLNLSIIATANLP